MATTHRAAEHSHLPPMGRAWLTPLYDPLQRLLGAPAVHRTLVRQADIRDGHRVLEIGCGTGNLVRLVKTRRPGATVVGIDPDLAALARARLKADRDHLEVQLDHGFAERLPYLDASFDVVLSAFMLHHLAPDVRLLAMREVLRVLVPGGFLHVVDLDGRDGRPAGVVGMLHRRRGPGHGTEDDVPALMGAAGLEAAQETGSTTTWLTGGLTFWAATAPLITPPLHEPTT